MLSTIDAGSMTATFSSRVDFLTAMKPYDLAVADFNADGKPDVAATCPFASVISVLINTTPAGATTPTFAAKVDLTALENNFDLFAIDFDTDGKPDLVARGGPTAAPRTQVFLNTTAPGATAPTFAPRSDLLQAPTIWSHNSLATGDVNGDGKPDVFFTDHVGQVIYGSLNTTAMGAPSLGSDRTFGPMDPPGAFVLRDVDLDGKPDAVVFGRTVNGTGPSLLCVMLNTITAGATVPAFAPPRCQPTADHARLGEVADFNRDGRPDLAITSGRNTADHQVVVFLGR